MQNSCRTISSFPSKTIRRRSNRTEHFARNKTEIIQQIVDIIVDVHKRNSGRMPTDAQCRAWKKPVLKLCDELVGKEPPVLRILEVISWYADQPGWRVDQTIPRVDSGQALYVKFSRLEDTMHVRTSKFQKTLDEVIVHFFNGSTNLSSAFRSDILVQSKQLSFGEISEVDLATKLGTIYNEIKLARTESATVSPMDMLRRYLSWLKDKDWTMTTRVFDIHSPAFQQFRRDESNMHPYGFDPLTGR